MEPLNALSEIFDKISMFLLTRSSSSSLPVPPETTSAISLGIWYFSEVKISSWKMMERKALMWTCLLKPQTKSGRIPKYPYCKEALTCQCQFKHFPANHRCLAIGRKKKNGLMCFIFSNKWQHVGATNKHYPVYKLQSTRRGEAPPYKNPLTGKNISRKGTRWSLSSEAISLVNHLSLRSQLVCLHKCWKMWVLPCVHMNWDHETPLCTVSHCHLGHLCDTGLSHMDLLHGVLTWTGFQPK